MIKKLLLLPILFIGTTYTDHHCCKPSERLRKMGMEAQDRIGVPKNRQATIEKICFNHSPKELGFLETELPLGCTYIKNGKPRIALSEYFLLPYGIEKFVACHEAKHIKERDHELTLLRRLRRSILGNVRSEAACRTMERRADTAAAEAIGCETCLSEYSLMRKADKLLWPELAAIYQAKGYLTPKELDEINKRLHEGKRCDYHNGSIAEKLRLRNERAFMGDAF